tara:strand:- start:661 stop:993 length:333 start_codon:yes stop_codon:yes gene_type:complete
MLNKIYSVIGHFFLRRTDEYWEDQGADERMSGYSNGIKDRSSSHQRTPDMEPSFNIRIYSAKGGRVVECHTSPASNSQFKSNSIDLYVIPDGTELVDELGKILMMHSLTK